MAIQISTAPTLSTIQVKERQITNLDENYSSPLVNFVERSRIDGVDYTKFYTEVDTNLSVGERVYIVNGNYDTYDIIEINPYRKGTNGYVILEIDRCAITLDIEWTGELPWNTDDFDNYIKFYASDNDQRTSYEVMTNGYYPYKYTYGFRANNNILFSVADNAFYVADPYNAIEDFANWTDVTTGIMSNSMPTLSGNDFTENNGKVLVMDDFTYNGQEFKKGCIYKFIDGFWIIDEDSKRSYLSKANFRDGRFAGGNWNDGIFGQIDKKIDWTGANWNNGVFFNANWVNGIMGSKSDSITRQSFYAFLEDGNIKQTTDFNNNSGFGYNFVHDSSFEKITINNANADNCVFGSYSATQSVIKRYLIEDPLSFDINLKNGRYVDSLIEDALIANGLYEFSDIENSTSTNGRFVDTNIDYSVAAGEYEGIGSIEIQGYNRLITSGEFLYDNPYVGVTSSYVGTTSSLVVNHKFYITEDNYLNIKAGSWINLNRLVTTNPSLLNFLDNAFYMGSDKNGELYIADNYGERSKVLVQLNSKEQNEKIRTIPASDEFPNFVETTQTNPRPSVDLYVHFDGNNIGENEFSLYQPFDLGSDVTDGWSLDVGSAIGVTAPSGGFFTSSNVSFGGSTTTSASYSVECEGGTVGVSYSIFSPSGLSGVDYLEYYWSTDVFFANPSDPIIHVAGLSGSWIGLDTITATDSNPFGGSEWELRAINITGEYDQFRITVEIPAFAGPNSDVKIDDILIEGSTFFEDLNVALDDWRTETNIDINYRQRVTNFEDATIQIANIEKTIFNGGVWKASKVNNVDYRIARPPGVISGTYGEYLAMTFSGGFLEVTLDDFSNILYPGQLEVDDVIALDNISYDLGGTVSQVDGLYLIATYSEAPLTLTLEDLGTQSIAGSYSSGGSFISSFIVDNGTYSISDIQPIFNSIHLEKIQDTTINQGFIKREFFESNIIDNDNFIIQTDLDITNVNRLRITEMLLDSSNDLTVRSGLFIRDFIKDTEWENGIIYRSMLKNLDVLDGVVSQSKWKSGTFSGGIFLDARKDTISDPDDLSLQFANQVVLSEWDDGEFTGGEFFDAIWDNGNFRAGKFYNSIFAAGYWYNGEFGDVRYNNADSQFGDGVYTHQSVNLLGHPVPTWFDGVFTNGEFGIRNMVGETFPAIIFPGSTAAPSNAVPFPPIGTMSWFNGTFNDGTIVSMGSGMPNGHGLEDQGGVIWHDGTFNNGDIIGVVRWLDGTFNQGKFRSAYGSGYGTESNNYAWENGIFNGGQFGSPTGLIEVDINTDVNPTTTDPLLAGGNPLISYQNPSWFNGRFNDGFFYGKVWNDGVFTGGRFVGHTQSLTSPFEMERWGIDVGTISSTNPLSIIEADLGEWTIEQNTVFNTSGGGPATLQIQQIPSFTESDPPFGLTWETSEPYAMELSPTASGSAFSPAIIIQTSPTSNFVSPQIDEEITGIEFTYFWQVTAEDYNVTWDIEIEAFGTDENGDPFTYTFVYPPGSVVPALNFPAGTPTTNGRSGIIQQIVPSSIPFVPSGAKYRISIAVSMAPLSIGAEFIQEDTLYRIDDIRFNKRKVKTASLPDQFVMDYVRPSTGFGAQTIDYFGLWRDGTVISDNTVAVAKSNFIRINQLEAVRKFRGERTPQIIFENALWANGTFSAFGQMDNCVWLNGSFKNGRFINSAFNPYVPRWDWVINHPTTVGKYSYELSDSCVWRSGYLDNSEFSVSEWFGGVFNSGDMIGGHFKGGVANYINAYNCIWEGGRWRNGNWYGANFKQDDLFEVTSGTFGGGTTFSTVIGKTMDILTTNAKRLGGTHSGNNELFLWNAFTGNAPDPYADSDSYEHWNGTTYQSGTFSNNDFILFGSMSETTTIGVGLTSADPKNRGQGLYYDNATRGYNVGAVLRWSSGFDPLEDQFIGNAKVTSRWGNGAFINGRWENGVWNNGVRLDESFNTESQNNIMEDVNNFFQVSPDRWQVELTGIRDISNLSLGDYISIGNIVGITVNGVRKFLKDSYQIISIDQTAITLSVIVKTSFPLRSIERDSENHKIYITKNVWENGKFHNGKFDGVWNSGRLDGYPRITHLENTYWIDGRIEGGRFSATENVDIFGNTFSTGLIQNAFINANGIFEWDNYYSTWLDVNWDTGYLDSRSTAIWGSPVNQPAQLALPIETTKDILSSRFRIYLGPELNSGIQSTLNRQEYVLELGDKFNYYDQLITDDLLGYQPGQYLGNNGWQFSVNYANGAPYQLFASQLPLTQSKFLGHTFLTGDAVDAMEIDTLLPPSYEIDYHPDYDTANGTFSWSDTTLKFNISNNDLLNIEKRRYWELSFTLVDLDWGVVGPYPGAGSTPPMVEGQTWKAYIWNMQGEDPLTTSVATQSQPLISLGGPTGFDGRIGEITFREVDSIPFYDYWSVIGNINTDAVVPLRSTSLIIEQSETDAVFIDNKSSTNTK